MATPPTAQTLPVTRDPADVKPVGFNMFPMLDPGEFIDTYTLTMSAEGTALGVSFATGGGRDPSLENDDTLIKAWPVVSAPHQADASFDGAGVSVPVTVKILTTSTPQRTHEETFLIPFAQK